MQRLPPKERQSRVLADIFVRHFPNMTDEDAKSFSLKVGVHQVSIRNIADGKAHRVRLKTLLKVFDLLDIPVEDRIEIHKTILMVGIQYHQRRGLLH